MHSGSIIHTSEYYSHKMIMYSSICLVFFFSASFCRFRVLTAPSNIHSNRLNMLLQNRTRLLHVDVLKLMYKNNFWMNFVINTELMRVHHRFVWFRFVYTYFGEKVNISRFFSSYCCSYDFCFISPFNLFQVNWINEKSPYVQHCTFESINLKLNYWKYSYKLHLFILACILQRMYYRQAICKSIIHSFLSK